MLPKKIVPATLFLVLLGACSVSETKSHTTQRADGLSASNNRCEDLTRVRGHRTSRFKSVDRICWQKLNSSQWFFSLHSGGRTLQQLSLIDQGVRTGRQVYSHINNKISFYKKNGTKHIRTEIGGSDDVFRVRSGETVDPTSANTCENLERVRGHRTSHYKSVDRICWRKLNSNEWFFSLHSGGQTLQQVRLIDQGVSNGRQVYSQINNKISFYRENGRKYIRTSLGGSEDVFRVR